MMQRYAALLGAAAWPLLAQAAAPTPTTPTDMNAAVPALTVPSAFDGYSAYRDESHMADGGKPSWQQLNRAVTGPAGEHGTSGKSGKMTGTPAAARSSNSGVPSAPLPSHGHEYGSRHQEAQR